MMISQRGVVTGGVSLSLGLGLAGLALASPAQAATCGDGLGTLMWSGSAYVCAGVSASPSIVTNPYKTDSWVSSISSSYSKRYTCSAQGSGLSISYVYATSPNPVVTYTAYNSATYGNGWAASVLWNTQSVASSQYSTNCSSGPVAGWIPAIQMRTSQTSFVTAPSTVATGTSATFTVKVTAPDGGGTPFGTVYLYWQKSSAGQSPVVKACDGSSSGADTMIGYGQIVNGQATIKTSTTMPAGKYNIYAAFPGSPLTNGGQPTYCLAPSQSGLIPSNTTTMGFTVGSSKSAASSVQQAPAQSTGSQVSAKTPKVAVVEDSAQAPKSLTVRCAPGQSPVQGSVGADKPGLRPQSSKVIDRGLKVTPKGVPDGARVAAQVVCRPDGAKKLIAGKMAYGSIKNDTLKLSRDKGVAFGGLGDDTLTVASGSAFGGPGNDAITVTTKGSAAGGPGADTLTSTGTGEVLLEGGLGKDTFVGSSKGTTLINAADGKGGDVVTCNSARTYVMRDKGDTLKGSCKKPSDRG